MRKSIAVIGCSVFLLLAGYLAGSGALSVAHAGSVTEGTIPKSYGRLVAAIADQIGTGLVFEAEDGTVRFVSMTGMKEGELARYEGTPTQGGIPKSYGHLVTAVVNNGQTALVFEDSAGTIRLLTITGVKEGELKRD